MRPDTISIADGAARLILAAASGEELAIDAHTLWAHCPSALRRRRRMEGLDLVAPPGITIRAATPIGNYAVNIAFSDGHDCGVYPWALLLQLARLPRIDDFLSAPMPAAHADASPNISTANISTAGHLP